MVLVASDGRHFPCWLPIMEPSFALSGFHNPCCLPAMKTIAHENANDKAHVNRTQCPDWEPLISFLSETNVGKGSHRPQATRAMAKPLQLIWAIASITRNQRGRRLPLPASNMDDGFHCPQPTSFLSILSLSILLLSVQSPLVTISCKMSDEIWERWWEKCHDFWFFVIKGILVQEVYNWLIL